MEKITIGKQSFKPVYKSKRGKKKKIYCKSADKHKEQQKDNHLSQYTNLKGEKNLL